MKFSVFDYATYRGWYGIDINPRISILEYGLLVREQINRVQVINARDYINEKHPTKYTIISLSKLEIDNFFKENSWADKEGVFDFADIKTLRQWKRLSYVNRIDILLSYYGYLNIIGDYSPSRDGMSLLACLNIADGFMPKRKMQLCEADEEDYSLKCINTKYGLYIAVVSHTVDDDGDFWYADVHALGAFTYYAIGHSSDEAIKYLKNTIKVLGKEEKNK